MQTKQKRTEKQSYKTHPILSETSATLIFQEMTYIDAYINFISVTCSPHNAKVKIGRYQRINRPIPIIGKTASNRTMLIIGRLLVHVQFVYVIGNIVVLQSSFERCMQRSMV